MAKDMLMCDICGGKLVMQAGGISKCDSCGMEYSQERMREKVQEIKGTVTVEGTVQTNSTQQQLEVAQRHIQRGNYFEAAKIYDDFVIDYPVELKKKLSDIENQRIKSVEQGRINARIEAIKSQISARNFSIKESQKHLDSHEAEYRKEKKSIPPIVIFGLLLISIPIWNLVIPGWSNWWLLLTWLGPVSGLGLLMSLGDSNLGVTKGVLSKKKHALHMANQYKEQIRSIEKELNELKTELYDLESDK